MLRSLLLAIAVFGLSAAGCSTTDGVQASDSSSVAPATMGEPFRLSEGESVQMAGHALRFQSVVEDSRCPENTTCVWEGRAKVRLAVSNPAGGADAAILTVPHGGAMSDGETATWTVDGATIELLALYPYPGSEAAEAGAEIQAEIVVKP